MLPPDLIPPSRAALCVPIALREQRGALVLLQAAGRRDFDPDHIAFARQCAVVSLAGLAVRNGNKLESEVQRLNVLVAQSRQSEQDTQQDNRLLQEIVDHLPIALTVQDAEGRFILVNSVAAANLATPVESLIGASPADFLSPDDAASRREWETSLIKSGRMHTVEESLGRSDRRADVAHIAQTSEHPGPDVVANQCAQYHRPQARRNRLGEARSFRRIDRLSQPHPHSESRRAGASAQEQERALRASLHRPRQLQAHQRLLQPCHRRRAAGEDRAADRGAPARKRHARAHQRRRIPAVSAIR